MTAPPLSPPPAPPGRPARVQRYLDALVGACTGGGGALTCVVLFGSAARGGFSAGASDVDLVVVLPDGASEEDRRRVRAEAARLEVAHGFRAARQRPTSALARFMERAGGNALPCFVCTRSDLLSGDVARILGLRPVEALFTDRIVLASIVDSAVTVWGEDLLPRVPVPPIRRLDVFRALFASASRLVLSAAAFPVVPDATRHAMGALKHSLHGCFYCVRRRWAPLEEEVAFFRGAGADRALAELLELRRRPRRSLAFVLRCLPAVVRLHTRAARDGRF
ncbi:MAG TPA: nucleotidyltransferase domain-containing protein, partial [Longimicrobiaceae bacterium]|nr:nucleotidyltransferase domain-containing protein [Longimicrobiaceae bacterium]